MGCSDAFGSAHSATLVHDITSSAMAGTPRIHIAGAPDSFMEKFDEHFGSLSAAATKSTVVMEALVSAITTQYD